MLDAGFVAIEQRFSYINMIQIALECPGKENNKHEKVKPKRKFKILVE